MSNIYDFYNSIEKFYIECIEIVKLSFPGLSEKDQIWLTHYLISKAINKTFNF